MTETSYEYIRIATGIQVLLRECEIAACNRNTLLSAAAMLAG